MEVKSTVTTKGVDKILEIGILYKGSSTVRWGYKGGTYVRQLLDYSTQHGSDAVKYVAIDGPNAGAVKTVKWSTWRSWVTHEVIRSRQHLYTLSPHYRDPKTLSSDVSYQNPVLATSPSEGAVRCTVPDLVTDEILEVGQVYRGVNGTYLVVSISRNDADSFPMLLDLETFGLSHVPVGSTYLPLSWTASVSIKK